MTHFSFSFMNSVFTFCFNMLGINLHAINFFRNCYLLNTPPEICNYSYFVSGKSHTYQLVLIIKSFFRPPSVSNNSALNNLLDCCNILIKYLYFLSISYTLTFGFLTYRNINIKIISALTCRYIL